MAATKTPAAKSTTPSPASSGGSTRPVNKSYMDMEVSGKKQQVVFDKQSHATQYATNEAVTNWKTVMGDAPLPKKDEEIRKQFYVGAERLFQMEGCQYVSEAALAAHTARANKVRAQLTREQGKAAKARQAEDATA